jgi:hypothetical protein
MTGRQRFADGSVFGRRYDYADGTVLAADFGPGEATVDVVDGTVIVVVGDDQYEFDVPGAARASVNNGVLTVEVTDDSGTDVDVEVDA